MAFKAIFQAFRGGGLKFIDFTTKFRLFIPKKCNKICWSPNLESYLHMRVEKNIEGKGAVFFINNLKPKTIYVCLDR